MEEQYQNGLEYPNKTWARAVRQIEVMHQGGLLSDAAKEWADILVIDLLVWSDAHENSELLVEKGDLEGEEIIFLVYAEDVTEEFTKGCQFSLTHVPDNPRKASAEVIKLVLGQMDDLDDLIQDLTEEDFDDNGRSFNMLDMGEDEDDEDDEEDSSEDWKKLR